MKTILVTGGAGFIGSNFIPYVLGKYENYRVVNLDKLTYAGNLSNLGEVVNHPRYLFIQGDCADRDLVTGVFREHDIKGVIHFAAESHVDNSITGPEVFIESNVRGTFMLLEISRRSWLDESHVRKAGYERCRFHHISTDEVYGSLGKTGLFTEDSRYAPNSPYSASKASADMIVRSYYHTYGLNTVMTNCSNNYGPKQHGEKLIPTIIRKALALEKIPIYGDGKNVRDWLFVLDHCRAIDMVYHFGEEGETYNIGARNERDNQDVANLICRILDDIAPENRQKSGIRSYSELIQFVKDRPGHDRRYAMDPTKIETKLGWRPSQDFEGGMLKTVEWYLKRSTGR